MYIVLELQNGASIIRAYTDRNEAESAYHMTLGAAAISEVDEHTVCLLTSRGLMLESKCYLHNQPEPEPETEPEPEA